MENTHPLIVWSFVAITLIVAIWTMIILISFRRVLDYILLVHLMEKRNPKQMSYDVIAGAKSVMNAE